MWNILICDDEQDVRTMLRSELERFAAESGEQFRFQECSSGEALLFCLKPDTDLIFLDIKMDGMTGMEAAKEIRRTNPEVCIIFLTSMVQYAVEGYQVHAWGFLRKPLSYAQLRLQMSDTIRHLYSRQELSISIQIGHEIHKLTVSSILYLEVLNHTVAIHMKSGTQEWYGTIAELEKQLEDKGFFRCHKSFMVNLKAVRYASADSIIMEDGSDVPISKRRRREFQEALTSYWGSVL